MHLQRKLFCALFSFACAGSFAATQPALVIQELIDRAASGDEVVVPAGEYAGSIRIKDGIILRGEGDDTTVLDAGGLPQAVTLGKKSAIIGFHIRNAGVLVNNLGNFGGVFECSLSGFTQHGVLFAGGSGALAHNRIEGNGAGTAIVVANANPLIVNNKISHNMVGIQIAPNLVPTITDNYFLSNGVAVAYIGSGVGAYLKRNIFAGNRQATSGLEAGDGNAWDGSRADGFALERGASTDAYRDLMREAYAAAVGDHPIIIYDLQPEPGAFDAIGLFPWATFTLSASAIDTRIESYRAFDIMTERSLQAEYAVDQNRPSVRVLNPEMTERMRERYVLENRYVHPASYFDDSAGRRFFTRLTNVAQIEIVIPKGYSVESCQPAGTLMTGADQRSVMVISSMGDTVVTLVLARAP